MTDSMIIVVTLILVVIGYTPMIFKIHRRLEKIEARLDTIEAKFQSEDKDKKGTK